jgi:hypothetical protein
VIIEAMNWAERFLVLKEATNHSERDSLSKIRRKLRRMLLATLQAHVDTVSVDKVKVDWNNAEFLFF